MKIIFAIVSLIGVILLHMISVESDDFVKSKSYEQLKQEWESKDPISYIKDLMELCDGEDPRDYIQKLRDLVEFVEPHIRDLNPEIRKAMLAEQRQSDNPINW
ncbi:uncharacterized protein LOC135842126 [Planococcus citri]|uniref:uncharacterized protein LOC135842126 n=1 Tax=Planococcus citri TaxID=170843 RepID=UPI0031F9AD96